MTIKRTELDILNMAIQIAEVKVHREFERDKDVDEYNNKNDVCFKKEDYKREYEHKLEMQRLDARIERWNEEINGLKDQLDLLRWLYKESENNNAK